MFNNDHDDDSLCGRHLADADGDAADHHTLVGYNAQTHLHRAHAAHIVDDGVGCNHQNNLLLCCHGGLLPLAEPGKDPTGTSHWFHEAGTHLYSDKHLVAEHSLARQVEEPYSHHHAGKEPVEHTAAVVDCSRNQDDDDDDAENVHLLFDTCPGLFSCLSCW